MTLIPEILAGALVVLTGNIIYILNAIMPLQSSREIELANAEDFARKALHSEESVRVTVKVI